MLTVGLLCGPCIVSWPPSLLLSLFRFHWLFSPFSILVWWWDLKKDLWIITYPLSNWGLACVMLPVSWPVTVPTFSFPHPFSSHIVHYPTPKSFTVRMKELLEVILMGRRRSVTWLHANQRGPLTFSSDTARSFEIPEVVTILWCLRPAPWNWGKGTVTCGTNFCILWVLGISHKYQGVVFFNKIPNVIFITSLL